MSKVSRSDIIAALRDGLIVTSICRECGMRYRLSLPVNPYCDACLGEIAKQSAKNGSRNPRTCRRCGLAFIPYGAEWRCPDCAK